ncbi:hypothetical protein G6514_000735 [Epicoccum nigrum]|nr:hypothetical protein G6514_000735 [Epicoccum nigrum]
MSPGKGTRMLGSPCTPPRTPNRSPTAACKGGENAKPTLEVGQNGFYFSIEIPEKKILPRSGVATPERRAKTPDMKKAATFGRGDEGRVTPNAGRLTPNAGRMTPSPEKQQRSEVKTGGRVRDILKKNLFGTPRGQTSRPASPLKLKEEDRMSPAKSCGTTSKASDGNRSEGGSRSERAPMHASSERATGAPLADSDTSRCSQSADLPSATLELPLEPQPAVCSVVRQQTPSINSTTPVPAKQSSVAKQKPSAVSTPFDIGELMANHSIKSSKAQPLPVSGLEGMPTPLRKMSERLGLKSPHVVRKEKTDRNGETTATAPMNEEGKGTSVSDVTTTPTSVSSPQRFTIRKGDRLPQLLPSLGTTISPVPSPYQTSTVTTPAFSSPATPSRPHGPGRVKSSGTPARLRSSMQEDMYKVQESLKRSLGPDVFQAVNSSSPATPSPATAPAREVTGSSTTARPTGALKNKTRPVSVYASAKSKESEIGTAQAAVPRRPLNTATRKPRPKSMVIGSAKMLETIASQLDSQIDRAKQRSASSTQQAVLTTSRPGTAASTEQGSKTTPKASKPPPTIRTTKAAALRAAAHAKDAAGSKPPTRAGGPQRKSVAGADRVVQRKPPSRPASAAATAPAPAPKPKPLARAKSVKAPSREPNKAPPPKRASPKTPEPPRDAKKDSGTFERKQEQSFTPPGQPTRLPGPARPRSRTQLVDIIDPAAAPALFRAPPFGVEQAAEEGRNRIPLGPRPAPPAIQVARHVSHEVKASALQSPSKEIQSSLDAAIDRKIAEDRAWARQMAGAGWF